MARTMKKLPATLPDNAPKREFSPKFIDNLCRRFPGYEIRRCAMPNWAFVYAFFYPSEKRIWLNVDAAPDAKVAWAEW